MNYFPGEPNTVAAEQQISSSLLLLMKKMEENDYLRPVQEKFCALLQDIVMDERDKKM